MVGIICPPALVGIGLKGLLKLGRDLHVPMPTGATDEEGDIAAARCDDVFKSFSAPG